MMLYKSTPIPDDEALLAFRLGEEKSLEFIIRRFQTELVFFANNILQQLEVAEEIVDDSFLKVWQRRTDFDALPALKSFLYKSVKNACLDYLKSPKNRRHQDIMNIDFEFPSPDDMEAKMIYAELLGLIYREAEQLPLKQKQVFLMSYIEGLSTAEIAGKLAISANAVSINKHEATKTMRKLLDSMAWILLLFLK